LSLNGKEPAALVAKLAALWQALPTATITASVVSASVIAIIVGLRQLNPKLPGFLIAILLAGLATWAFSLPVETIGTRFGSIPGGLPMPALPPFSLEKAWVVLPDALAIAFLAGLESLLSAMVADGMSGRRHRANAELVAQGIANMASSLFGGLCVTGTIARTATNIRAGAVSPVSGMLHSIFLLGFMLAAAPLAKHIPLAALAGMLAVVAWNMADRKQFAAALGRADGNALVVLVTFGLVLFVDLIYGIAGGCALAYALHLWRGRITTP
ncbi:MAG: SulP family inorganic anion transporter, partial [Caldilineaceae bacterium]